MPDKVIEATAELIEMDKCQVCGSIWITCPFQGDRRDGRHVQCAYCHTPRTINVKEAENAN